MLASIVVLLIAGGGIAAVILLATSHIWVPKIQHRVKAKRALKNVEEEYWELVGRYK